MAGLLTPEEWAAAAGARFGPGQLGPTALGLSECCGILLACLSILCCCMFLIGPLTRVNFLFADS
jgi:hypothetical protein